MVLTALFKPSTSSLGRNSDRQRRIRACFAVLKGHAAWTVKLFTNMELVEFGGVVMERLAVQHLVLLLLRFLFPAFVKQHGALCLVAVSIQQARQGKARQGNPSTLLHAHAWHMMLCPWGTYAG